MTELDRVRLLTTVMGWPAGSIGTTVHRYDGDVFAVEMAGARGIEDLIDVESAALEAIWTPHANSDPTAAHSPNEPSPD